MAVTTSTGPTTGSGMGARLGGHLRENGMLMALVAIVASSPSCCGSPAS